MIEDLYSGPWIYDIQYSFVLKIIFLGNKIILFCLSLRDTICQSKDDWLQTRTRKHPVIERSVIHSQGISAELRCLCSHHYLVWKRRGLTMPARTLGSWEAMTSDIISGNSTFMASAWMKVLRQNRLTFFTICRRRNKHICSWCFSD